MARRFKKSPIWSHLLEMVISPNKNLTKYKRKSNFWKGSFDESKNGWHFKSFFIFIFFLSLSDTHTYVHWIHEHSSLSDICDFRNGWPFVENNVPIAFILPSRWQDGAEGLGIGTTSCLCHGHKEVLAHKITAALKS